MGGFGLLIDFTVGNYRSINEPVTLSMVARGKPTSANGKTRRRIKSDHEIAQSFPIEGRDIVRLFQSEKTNPNHAQLIFNTHDNTLQRGNLLRRDQIWFTERRGDGSTNLYPLQIFDRETIWRLKRPIWMDGLERFP